ncbi:MAG TPA: hypothetical protein VMA37_02075 [Acetobacteraceae bacterium]|nr:hypothetical protein [Acetobacteraceae bacterium]
MSTGITIDIPENAQGDEGREVSLPSGAVARIRRAKGKDVRKALMMVGQPFDPSRYSFAMIACITKIDGKGITMEGMDDLDADDVVALMTEVNGGRPSPEATGENATG